MPQGGVHPPWNERLGLRLVKKPVLFAVRLTGAVFSRALPREKPVRHRSSVVEHTLGKGEVTGSSPVGGFGFPDRNPVTSPGSIRRWMDRHRSLVRHDGW